MSAHLNGVTRAPLEFRATIRTPASAHDDEEVLLPEDIVVRSLELEEELDAPYTLTAVLVAEDTLLDVDRLVGSQFELDVSRRRLSLAGDGGSQDDRQVHGVVLRADYLGTHSHRMLLRVVVGPALSLLALTRRSRVFQELTAVEIATAVVADVFAATGRVLVVDRLRVDHPVIDYCVQHRETDLDFMQRVLAEAGITFVWDHEGDAERLVLLDANDTFVPLGHDAVDGSDGEPPTTVPVLTSGAGVDIDGLSRFGWTRRMRTGAHEVHAWDWKDSSPRRLTARAEPQQRESWDFGESFDHDRRRLLETATGTGPHLDATDDAAERHAARSGVETARADGAGNLLAATAGATFECTGHPNPHLERQFVMVRVHHRVDIPAADVFDDGLDAAEHYVNEFEAIPLEQTYRPQRRRKPEIRGPQLATVIGPPGEEIHTDALGRVKVWMHWDREGQAAGTHELSCWVRVAQLWAGAGYGAFFLPRVGMEVVVQFLDGDPDRPLIAGCVYNGQHPPPYAMPDERTKTTIKTASSPGGVEAGYNELRFEDARDREQVYLHAQRNFDERVRANHSTRVGVDQSLTVGRDRSKTVRGDEERTIDGSRTTVIGGSTKTNVAGGREVEIYCGASGPTAPAGVDKVSVLGERQVYADERVLTEVGPGRTTSMDVTPEEIVLRASSKIELRVGHTILRITPEKIWALSETVEAVTSGASLRLDDKAELRSANDTKLRQGGALLHMKKDKARLQTSGTKLIASGKTESTITMGESVDVQGRSVHLQTVDKASNVTVSAEGVSSRGKLAKHEADLIYKIKATQIELN